MNLNIILIPGVQHSDLIFSKIENIFKMNLFSEHYISTEDRFILIIYVYKFKFILIFDFYWV